MNDTSMTARPTGSGRRNVSGGRDRGARHGYVPSTRPADRRAAHRQAVRGPRREHRRGAAPRRSSTSVKPPVEAPTSRQTRPRGSMPNASSAAASFSPPRDTIRRALGQRDDHVSLDELTRLAGCCARRHPCRPGPVRRAPGARAMSRSGASPRVDDADHRAGRAARPGRRAQAGLRLDRADAPGALGATAISAIVSRTCSVMPSLSMRR